MKVIFGSFSAIGFLGGGVDIQVRFLSEELIKLGVEVELFNPWRKYDFREYDLFHLFGAHNGTYHLGRAVKQLGIKLIVTPVFFSRLTPSKLRIVTELTELSHRFWGIWSEHLYCQQLCQMADLVLVNTGEEKKLILKSFGIPEEKIGKIPNGVDRRFYYASPERFYQEFSLENFVLYVGHIGYGRKNLLPLLRILKRHQMPAVLIGRVLNTSYASKCQEIINSSPNIRLLTEMPNDSPLLISAYAACNTFVLPSFYETPGLAALEAGLAGAKVCITRYGGTQEYFGDHATYLEPKSENSIERAVISCYYKSQTPHLKEHIYSNFLWEAAATRLIEYYYRVVRER